MIRVGGRFINYRWTAERVLLLRRLVHENKLHTDEMRALLGAPSDQAVRTKATSLGLSIKRKPARRAPLVRVRPTPPNVIPLVTEALVRHPDLAVAPEAGNNGARVHATTAWPCQIAAYVLHVELGFTQAEAGAAVGRSEKTVWHSVRRVEGLRDEVSGLDDLLYDLGEQAKALAA